MSSDFKPRYRINYEALIRCKNAQAIVLFLTHCVNNPAFRRESKCHPCKEWDRGNKSLLEKDILDDMKAREEENAARHLDEKPDKPGAFDPTAGCSGCYYSYLDEIEDAALDDAGHIEFLIQNLELAIEEWEMEDIGQRSRQRRTYDCEPQGGGRPAKAKHVERWPEHTRKIAEARALLVQYRSLLENRRRS